MQLCQLSTPLAVFSTRPRSKRAGPTRVVAQARRSSSEESLHTSAEFSGRPHANDADSRLGSAAAAAEAPLAFGRRAAMAGVASLAVISLPSAEAIAAEDAAKLLGIEVDLEKRLSALEGYGWPGPFSGPYVSKLFYPNWMFGEWSAESVLADFSLPKGARVAPREAAAVAKLEKGRAVPYQARFYSTLPDSFANTLRVNLGVMPQQKVIADRAYNRLAYTNAVLGIEAVQRVDIGDGGRETVVFRRGTAKTEIYQSNVRQTDLDKAADPDVFRTAECYRQVRVGVEQVDVRDYEILHRFARVDADRVLCRQRVAVYLTPQDAEYFAAPGQAVAVYDYDITFARRRGPPTAAELEAAKGSAEEGVDDGGEPAVVGAPGEGEGAEGIVCVLTPKSVVQCVDA